jgi:hypothetical protein
VIVGSADHWNNTGLALLFLQRFVEEKQIGEDRAQMNGRVQVVHEL